MSNSTTVLVVEDDPLLGDLVVSDLKSLFPLGEIAIFGPAETYPKALELLHTVQPDIVLLDIELNGDKQAGIRLAQHINQTLRTPVIFLSGLPRQSGFDIAKFTAPFGYIQKPYHRQQLADQLELVMIRKSQAISSEATSSEPTHSKPPKPGVIFVATAHGELTALPLERLVLLEADGKTIRAYLTEKVYPIVFTSPGLKNFFQEHEEKLAIDFFQLSRKHIVCLSKIHQIKHNHVHLVQKISTVDSRSLSIPIPQNGESRKRLYELLGRVD